MDVESRFISTLRPATVAGSASLGLNASYSNTKNLSLLNSVSESKFISKSCRMTSVRLTEKGTLCWIWVLMGSQRCVFSRTIDSDLVFSESNRT